MCDHQNRHLPFTAFILAGGIGSRLRSVVSDRPKPMAMIGDRPFLEILIESLADKGITRIVLLTGFMSEHIEQYAVRYGNLNVTIEVSRETTPLGTGGAVRNALDFASDPTLLVNGDTYFESDIKRLYEFHQGHHADVTLSLCRVPDVGRYGAVLIRPDGLIEDFQEKSEIIHGPGLINAGFSMVSHRLIESLPHGKAFSMENDIFPPLIQGERMYGLEQSGSFFDIGTPDSYFDFVEYVSGHKKT